MYNSQTLKNALANGEFSNAFTYLYNKKGGEMPERYSKAVDGFVEVFGDSDGMRVFSAPGRTEIGGNHTDHQHGCVLAASLNLDVIGAVALNGTDTIRIKSKNYPLDEIDIHDLDIKEAEFDIMFGEGISKEGDILDLAAEIGVVNKSGAWYAYDGNKIGQGRENAKQYLKDNAEVCAVIEAKVREHYGIEADVVADDTSTKKSSSKKSKEE